MKYTCIYISPTIRGLGSLGSTGNIHSQSSVKRRLKDGTFEFFPTDRDLGQETRVDCTVLASQGCTDSDNATRFLHGELVTSRGTMTNDRIWHGEKLNINATDRTMSCTNIS
jgi:hypothetical protein